MAGPFTVEGPGVPGTQVWSVDGSGNTVQSGTITAVTLNAGTQGSTTYNGIQTYAANSGDNTSASTVNLTGKNSLTVKTLTANIGDTSTLTYLTATAKGLILPAMVLIYVLTGNLDFANNINSGILPADVNRWVVTALYACCILGFAKNGVMPFHSWLPSAMVAPTPVSALLHAVAVVKVGVFSTVRVMLFVFGVDRMNALNLGLPTAYFVSITIVVASIVALSKDNLKARLAYSTVSQLSYIILGVALLKPSGIEGGLVHIANHAFSKITLFFCAGAIYVATHKKSISEMNGLGRVMPFTFGAFALASLSMIGAPPVAGFVSKWYLLNGAFDAGSIGIIVVLLVSTLLNTAYFAPVVYNGFFGKPSEADLKHKFTEAHPLMVVPLAITAAISVVIGLYPGFFMSFVHAVL